MHLLTIAVIVLKVRLNPNHSFWLPLLSILLMLLVWKQFLQTVFSSCFTYSVKLAFSRNQQAHCPVCKMPNSRTGQQYHCWFCGLVWPFYV